MNVINPTALLMTALVLAIAGFILCITIAVFPFVGLDNIFAAATPVLFVAAFPLFFGALRVFVRRIQV